MIGNKVMVTAICVVIAISLITSLIDMTAFWILVGVAGFVFLLLLCMKYKWARVATVVVSYVALIGGTWYSWGNLNEYYSAEGGVFGKIENILDINQVEVNDLTFDFSNVELRSTGNENEYSAKIVSNKILVLEEEENFGIYVNGTPCGYVESSTNHVTADYRYVFYDEEQNIKLVDTLQFRFALNKNNTEFIIKTQGGQEAVDLWNDYFAKNNFNVQIKSTDYRYTSDIEIGEGEVSFALANYYINEEKYLTQLYHIGDKVSFPYPTAIDSTFEGWSIDGVNVIDSYTINQTTNFYALVSEVEYINVPFMFNDTTLFTQRVIEGEVVTKPEDPAIEGYIFDAWVDAEGELVDFANLTASADTVVYASCTAEFQTVTVKYVLADDVSIGVNAGLNAVGQYTYAGATDFIEDFKPGNRTQEASIIIPSGNQVTFNLAVNHFFTTRKDSTGRVRYVVLENNDKSTNVVTFSKADSKDVLVTGGYIEESTVTISNINSDMTICVLVDPIYFDIEFKNQGAVLATAYNVMYGEVINLEDYLTTEQIEALKSVDSIKGWNTYEIGQGIKIFDGTLKMLQPWTELGYKWNGSSYTIDSFYNKGTNTFSLFANTRN